MATFPAIDPTYPLSLRKQPRVVSATFGDGYSMDQPDGINSNLRRFDLTFERVTGTNKDTIDTFLDSQKGTISFDWTPYGYAAGKWVCKTWSIDHVEYDQYTIKAVFEERPI